MRLLILHRTIATELLETLLFSTLGFTIVSVLGLGFQFLQNGMPSPYLPAFLACLLAPIAVNALPMGCLCATTLTYSRLSAQQEIQAAQWSGVRLWTCAAPAILLGALASLACAVLNDKAVPASYARMRRLQENAAKELPLILAATAEPVYATPTQKMYINGFEGEAFTGVTVMETTNSVTTRILNARQAIVRYDRDRKAMQFDLVRGSLEIFDPGPPPKITDQAEFERYPFSVAFDSALEARSDWKDATRQEIREALRRRAAGNFAGSGEPAYATSNQVLSMSSFQDDRATDVVLEEDLPDGNARVWKAREATIRIDVDQGFLAVGMSGGRVQTTVPNTKQVLDEAPFEQHAAILKMDPDRMGLDPEHRPTSEAVRNLIRERVVQSQQVWYKAKVEVQERMSLALAALCFTLVGVPLGIWLKHGNRLVSFGVSLLVVLCLYVPSLAAGKSLSLSGRIPAWAGLWLPNAVMAGSGLLFFRRVRR